jgi:hypothetical protein
MQKAKRLLTHLWWAPSYYFMRLAIRWFPKHPFHRVKDIHDWAAGSTLLNKRYNIIWWMVIVIEITLILQLFKVI